MKQYTKEALSNKLKALAQTKPINKITITELVEACDIKRQTFYYHFQDIYDLLGWTYRTEVVNVIEAKCSVSGWQEGLDGILCYIEDNKEFCMNTCRSLSQDHLQNFLNQVLYELLGRVIDEMTTEKGIMDRAKRFIILFYSYAFSGILIEWINNNLEEPHCVIGHNITVIMEDNFQHAIEKEYQ